MSQTAERLRHAIDHAGDAARTQLHDSAHPLQDAVERVATAVDPRRRRRARRRRSIRAIVTGGVVLFGVCIVTLIVVRRATRGGRTDA